MVSPFAYPVAYESSYDVGYGKTYDEGWSDSQIIGQPETDSAYGKKDPQTESNRCYSQEYV